MLSHSAFWHNSLRQLLFTCVNNVRWLQSYMGELHGEKIRACITIVHVIHLSLLALHAGPRQGHAAV